MQATQCCCATAFPLSTDETSTGHPNTTIWQSTVPSATHETTERTTSVSGLTTAMPFTIRDSTTGIPRFVDHRLTLDLFNFQVL